MSTVLDGQVDIWTCGSMQAKPPDVRVHEACHWIRQNRQTWTRLRTMLHDIAADPDALTVRRGDLYILAQQRGWHISECREFRFDNNLWSVLSRIAIMQDRTLARVIHPKRCDVDTVDVAAIYREDVDLFSPMMDRSEFMALMGWSR